MEFAKEHCLNTIKSEVAKKQKVRSTRRKFRVNNVRRARNKNEVATEREKQFLASNKKRAKFRKIRSTYSKAKKQEFMDRKIPLLMYRNRKGLVQSFNTIYKENGDCVTIPYVFDCDTKRIVKEGYLNDELRDPFYESFNTIYKENGNCVTIPYVFDCDTKRIVKEGYLNDELRDPFYENAFTGEGRVGG